jgi:hypothetical protein
MPFWDRFGKQQSLYVDQASRQQPYYARVPDDATSPLVIVVHNTMNAQIVFSQLEDYLEKLEHDKRTRYDGNPRYCEEDENFLTEAIDRTRIMIHHLALSHSTLVRKM